MEAPILWTECPTTEPDQCLARVIEDEFLIFISFQ